MWYMVGETNLFICRFGCQSSFHTITRSDLLPAMDDWYQKSSRLKAFNVFSCHFMRPACIDLTRKTIIRLHSRCWYTFNIFLQIIASSWIWHNLKYLFICVHMLCYKLEKKLTAQRLDPTPLLRDQRFKYPPESD